MLSIGATVEHRGAFTLLERKEVGTGRDRVSCPRTHTLNSPLRECTIEMELESGSSRVWNLVRLKLGPYDSEPHVSVLMLYTNRVTLDESPNPFQPLSLT